VQQIRKIGQEIVAVIHKKSLFPAWKEALVLALLG
jgi:hypothetical protein